MITFKCTECENKFKAIDIEYNCTVFSTPQKCPKCNSVKTIPYNEITLFGHSFFGSYRFNKKTYSYIWEKMENRKRS